MSDPPPLTISIIGAGIAGPVLALSILTNPTLHARYKPIIYEKFPEPQNADGISTESYAAGAAVALTSNALFPLYELGLKDELDKISAETTRIQIWRAWKGGAFKWYNQIVNPGWKAELGSNLRVVERRELQGLLLRRVRELGGQVVWGRKVEAVEDLGDGEGVELRFTDGSIVSADLCVGADGIWSAVRKHITGGEAKRYRPDFFGADGIYGVSKSTRLREDGDEQGRPGDTHWILLDSGAVSTWALPDGKQFWTLSLPAKSTPSRNITGENAEFELYGAKVTTGGYTRESTETILRAHENVWHPVAGSCSELFKNSERIVRSPLWHRAFEAGDIGSNNCVLIGDASRVMLPSSGQGACFGIEDATVLANELLNNPPVAGSFQKAINSYVAVRVPRSKAMARQSYWTAVVSLGERWWWRWLRDVGSRWLPMGGDPKT